LMAEKRKILVVEDEEAIRRGIVDALEFARYEVEEASDGDIGLERALAPGLDLLLLDLMLPKRTGWEILSDVRKAKPRLPVIILTARGAEEDKVKGLTDGADDYMVKPFSAKELLARVEAVLRRSAERPNPKKILAFPSCTVDFEKSEIVDDTGRVSDLSSLEADLFSYLAYSPTRTISRQEILERVWGINAKGLDTRAVDMLVVRIRNKLGNGGAEIIRTVRGKGYRIGQIQDEGGS